MTQTGDARREMIARDLTGARQRTALLTDSVDEADLVRQHSPLMSPLVWDMAHIANREELWLLREVGGRERRCRGRIGLVRPDRPGAHPHGASPRPRSRRPAGSSGR
jgi:DinB superfamily